MNTTNDNWSRIECGECKYFKVNADMQGVESTCKRLDHKHLRFAKKTFKCYDCGQWETHTCAAFEPKDGVVWLKEHWAEVKEQIIPYKENEVIFLNVDGDADVRYAVRATEFYNNTFKNTDGSLRWVYKYYYERSRKTSTGYKTVYELPDGTKFKQRPLIKGCE